MPSSSTGGSPSETLPVGRLTPPVLGTEVILAGLKPGADLLLGCVEGALRGSLHVLQSTRHLVANPVGFIVSELSQAIAPEPHERPSGYESGHESNHDVFLPCSVR